MFNFEGKSFKNCQMFKAHDREVSQVHYFKGSLVSGGNDGTIKMWNEREGLVGELLHGSKVNWITCSSISKCVIIVADQSSNVNVYEIDG